MKETPPEPAVPSLVVGTIGHFQHGKTTLSSALTRVAASLPGGRSNFISHDQLCRSSTLFYPRAGWRDERPRKDNTNWWYFYGCTCRSVSLWYATERVRYSHIDCPGHFGMLKNFTVGASLLDVAIVVVSAEESVQEQTREHIFIAKALGVERFVVFLNKCDLIEDAGWLDMVETDIREAFSSLGLSGDSIPIIRGAALPASEGDARWTPCITALIEAIEREILLPARRVEGPFLMVIERPYSITGRGTVAVGRVLQGRLKVEEPLEVIGFQPEPIKTFAKTLKIFQTFQKTIQAGDFAGVLLQGIRRDDVRRGHAVISPGAFRPTPTFTCSLSLLSTQQGGRHTAISSGHQAQLYFTTASTTGFLTLPEPLSPGEEQSSIGVTLWYPLYLEVGQRFLVCDGTAGQSQQKNERRLSKGIIGTGVITSLSKANY